MEALENKIRQWIAPKMEQEDLFLVDIIISSSFKIQVFVDADESVSIRKCIRTSRFLEEYLDEESTVPEKYTLEVSSPGMSNPLKLPRQFKKRIGQFLKITFFDGDMIGAKLLEVSDENIVVQQSTLPTKGKKRPVKKTNEGNNPPLTIEYKDIKKAILHFNF